MRGHNQGTLFPKTLPNGKTLYVVRVSLPDGKRRERTSMVRKTAEGYLTEMLRQVGRGVEPRHRLTVASFLDAWVSDLRVRVQTLRRYRSIVDIHLKDGIGHIPIQGLRPSHVEKLLASKRPATAQQCRAVLRTALNAALRDGLVEYNAAERARPVDYEAEEAEIMTIEEARRFLEAVADDRLHALWLLACTTAMREAELLGLSWRDVDFQAGHMAIRQQLIRVKGEFIVGPPKSRRGTRTIALSALTWTALRAHQKRMVTERGRIMDLDELVFTTEKGLPLYGYRVVAMLRGHLERIEIKRPKLKLHELRHTAASFMVAEGIPEPAIREVLGHKTVRLLMERYAHSLPGQSQMVADRMQALLGG